MTDGQAFPGFPAVARATAIPNVFFSVLLPQMRAAGDLLAFLWVSRLVQEQRSDIRFVSAESVWAAEGAAEAFNQFGAGRAGLDTGLARCVEIGALLAVEAIGADGSERLYFVNEPGSRRAVVRARAGEVALKPETVVQPIAAEPSPGIFRLYEENVGTITALVGDRLLAAADEYPAEWIEQAFREAAELNKRNWRYIERILQNWSQEGRHETTGRDPGEAQQRFLGGTPQYVARRR